MGKKMLLSDALVKYLILSLVIGLLAPLEDIPEMLLSLEVGTGGTDFPEYSSLLLFANDPKQEMFLNVSGMDYTCKANREVTSFCSKENKQDCHSTSKIPLIG